MTKSCINYFKNKISIKKIWWWYKSATLALRELLNFKKKWRTLKSYLCIVMSQPQRLSSPVCLLHNYCGCILLRACPFIDIAHTSPLPCINHIHNCQEYGDDLCTNPLYRLFREDNCRKFCGLCTRKCFLCRTSYVKALFKDPSFNLLSFN